MIPLQFPVEAVSATRDVSPVGCSAPGLSIKQPQKRIVHQCSSLEAGHRPGELNPGLHCFFAALIHLRVQPNSCNNLHLIGNTQQATHRIPQSGTQESNPLSTAGRRSHSLKISTAVNDSNHFSSSGTQISHLCDSATQPHLRIYIRAHLLITAINVDYMYPSSVNPP